MNNIFIAGSGFMGTAIGYLVGTATQAKVTLYDVFPAALPKAATNLEKMSDGARRKHLLLTEQWQEIKTRIKFSQDLQDAQSADLVIEAIAEEPNAKRKLFAELDTICPKETIFASNTSSLPITDLAAATKRADRFIGMHFFSPAHVMKLLELIPAFDTAPDTVLKVRQFGESLKKIIIMSKDLPGFITTRLGMVLMNEAAFALMEGLSSAEEIDKGMSLGYNHPMGPLALADFIGLDICLSAMETIHRGFGESKYRPCPLIRQLVSAGHLGRKTGRGFYDYGGAN